MVWTQAEILLSWKKVCLFCCTAFQWRKVFLPGRSSLPLWTIYEAGSYMLRWHPAGLLLPFVTCPQGFLQLVKRLRSASLHLTFLNNISSTAQINYLTRPRTVTHCYKACTKSLKRHIFLPTISSYDIYASARHPRISLRFLFNSVFLKVVALV